MFRWEGRRNEKINEMRVNMSVNTKLNRATTMGTGVIGASGVVWFLAHLREFSWHSQLHRRGCRWAGGVCGLAGLLLTSALVNPSSAWGENQSVPPLTLSLAGTTPSSPRSIWKDGVGNGFREDAFDAGFAIGAGFGVRAFGGTTTHDLALASVHLGWVFTDVVAEDKWWRGNWEWLIEVFSGGQFNPEAHYFLGGTTGLRYNFATGSRWVPFVDGGIGPSGTDIERPDLDGTFQANVQVGVGTHYFVRDDTAVTLQYRWLHFSDGGTTYPNHGVNTEMFEGGLTWFF
ncbi:MAG: acyloxyacyl hydrolase [Verrucomicrobiia bacterium]